ncbi:uncharacterized protein LOC115451976 [Manduca sexta]|uniref:uncharacterized protein LOC115451976 n=1 Tax=Manduca sexta TaxID=7130 RepID=UPI00188EFBA6|nr:uncharacterized protein LOC115451976 [Manduca sexta]XP_037292290.1 uncharacterized protein LOC115451976 [Manduca sexta]
MSTLQNTGPWSLSDKPLESKYEKCRNITEEIYKRINITFQIKKLEATHSEMSEHSDQIDSNELSNETDLFACDKTDTISSSTDDRPAASCEKYININNNEETKKKLDVTYKRPRKRFRKRVKKSQSKSQRSDSDASSDEAPLSRIVELDAKCVKANQVEPHSVMGVPNIVIVANLKPKLYTPEKKQPKNTEKATKAIDTPAPLEADIDKGDATDLSMKNEKSANIESKHCTMCSLSFKGERGLRRHMAMSHIVDGTAQKTEQRGKPA